MSIKIIIAFLVLILILPSCLLKFILLSKWNYVIQGLVILFGAIELLLSSEVIKLKNFKFYLTFFAASILWFGILLIIINLRLTKLQPIAFATAHLELNIKPTKIDKSKMGPSPLVGIDLVKVKGKINHHFMRIANTTSWGRTGLAEILHIDYSMDWFSVGYGEPFDFIDKYEAIEFTLFMLPKNTEIIRGRCVFTFNGIIRREIKIPPQKISLFSVYYINPKKKKKNVSNLATKDRDALAFLNKLPLEKRGPI